MIYNLLGDTFLISVTWDFLIIMAVVCILWSRNNIIILLNFLSILMLLSFKLLSSGIIEFTIVIIMVYQSAIIILFLVNSLHLSNLAWELLFIFMFFGGSIMFGFLTIVISSPIKSIKDSLFTLLLTQLSIAFALAGMLGSCTREAIPLAIMFGDPTVCTVVCLSLLILILISLVITMIIIGFFRTNTIRSWMSILYLFITIFFSLISITTIFILVFGGYNFSAIWLLFLLGDLIIKYVLYRWGKKAINKNC